MRKARALKPLAARFWAKVTKTDQCWVWTAYKNKSGYGNLKVNGSMKKAHRVSWELTVGDIPAGLHVLHKCDNPSCVRPSHLFLGTHLDNVNDMHKKGRAASVRGVFNGNHKLKNNDVIQIRQLSTTESPLDIAKRFGISRNHVYAIIGGTFWKHL